MKNQQIDPEKMTRQQYREWQKQQQQIQENPEPPLDDVSELTPLQPRQTVKKAQAQQLAEEKTARLKRRLNWAILGLSLAIIVVYLILFFVG
ncbi:hypothetical protein PZE05_03520 [Limosilactobacillus mucosae]|nr:hypothetical protein [Limosilactobacillus mucosae]MDE8677255.1 hypothetical protein [Limosilactobacillus mucosae]